MKNWRIKNCNSTFLCKIFNFFFSNWGNFFQFKFENQFFIGGVAGLDKVNVVNFVGPSFMLKTKQDRVFTIGVGYSNAKTISFQLGTYWLIKFKKWKN